MFAADCLLSWHPKQAGGLMEYRSLGMTLAEIQRDHILNTLSSCHGNRTRTAKILDVSIRGLRNKLHDDAQSGCSVRAANCHCDRSDDEDSE